MSREFRQDSCEDVNRLTNGAQDNLSSLLLDIRRRPWLIAVPGEAADLADNRAKDGDRVAREKSQRRAAV
jgi:hypothetical protein